LIQADHITKYYRVGQRKQGRFAAIRTLFSPATKKVLAVDDMSFHIPKGGFVGYIGPNGAGKSTTIKMLTGILHPDAGELLVDGLSPQKNRKRVARKIGVVFGQRTQLWWDLPVRDSFDLLAAMYGIEPHQYKKCLSDYAALLELHDFMETPVRKLSLGQRMRADLCAALLHQPDVLFLDEPTIGLDVVAKTRIRTFLRELNEQEQKTILLTTHDMDDIEELCKQIIMINHGQKVYDGSLSDLKHKYKLPTRLEVEYDGPVKEEALPQGTAYDASTRKASILFDQQTERPLPLIERLGQCGEIKDLSVQPGKIEDIIHHMYVEDKKDRY
jgi:ABC-2 type transport system ATP-binding protein